MPKYIVEPYVVSKSDKQILDKLKCDLLRRISLRNGYQAILDSMIDNTEFHVKDEWADFFMKLNSWVYELNNEIWMSIKGYRLPLVIEER